MAKARPASVAKLGAPAPIPASATNAPSVDPGIPWLVGILILAAALRLYGLGWGLPDDLHGVSFHPDESVMLVKSLPDLGGIDLARGNFLPHFYNYGSLPFYLINIAVLIGSAYHLIGPVTMNGRIDTVSLREAYLAARLLSVTFGVGTVWAVYCIGRTLWTTTAGLAAALILAIVPLHVQHSHFGTVDVGATFWQMLALVWAVKVLRTGEHAGTTDRGVGAPGSSRSSYGYAALSGMFAGLTAATKYSGVLVILPVVIAAAYCLRYKAISVRSAASIVGIAALAAAVAFLITCPGSILDTGLFVSGIQYESNHVMHHGEIYFQNTGPGWIYIVSRNLDAGMGLPLLIVALAAVAYAIYRRSPADTLLASFALPYYLLTGAAESRYARYDIPLLPILALWIARMLIELPGLAGTARERNTRLVVVAITGLILAFTIVDTWVLIEPMTGLDTRERAAVWLKKAAPAPTRIAFGGRPWFFTVAVNGLFSAPQPGAWIPLTPPAELARYCYNPNEALDPSILAQDPPPVAVLSEYEYYDALRLRQPNALAYVDALRRLYNPPVIFADPHPIGGLRSIDGLPVQDLPTDMLYTRPTELVFTLK